MLLPVQAALNAYHTAVRSIDPEVEALGSYSSEVYLKPTEDTPADMSRRRMGMKRRQ